MMTVLYALVVTFTVIVTMGAGFSAVILLVTWAVNRADTRNNHPL